MKLKTLKDLNVIPAQFEGIVTVKDLKQEAIKWVKDIKKQKDEVSAVWMLRKFFNITEDDLK